DAAGPRRYLHHPDLYSCGARTPQGHARQAPPARLTLVRAFTAHPNMTKDKHVSETPATQFLKQHKISFTEHPYDYVDHGGATEAARQLGLDLHQVAKTLIMEDEQARPLIVVMHGDCEVSTKNLARQIGAKKVGPCTPDTAQKHSGYLVGGTSPFATRKKMPVWVEAALL